MLTGEDRRQQPREAASETVKLVGRSGHPVLDAVAVDRSLRGMRVRACRKPPHCRAS